MNSSIYNRYDFLEIFDNERIIEEVLGNVEYTLNTQDGHSLCIFINPIEHFITLTVEYKKNPLPIFDIGFHNITKISCDKQKKDIIRLCFYQKINEQPIFALVVKPYISLNLTIDLLNGSIK